MKESKRQIGKIRAAHGLKGEVFLYIFSDEQDWFEDVSEIFLEAKISSKSTSINMTSDSLLNKKSTLNQAAGLKLVDQSQAHVGTQTQEQPAQFISYKVQSYRPHKEGVLVFLEGVTDRNQSEALQGSMVWVDAETFVTEDDDEDFFLTEIENFEVFDGDRRVGIVSGFSYNGDHDLVLVKNSESDFEYSIPLVEDFIAEIDFENKKLMMNLPEGLLEIQKE